MSLMSAVTIFGGHSSTVNIFPIGFSLPKYFFAADAVSTIEFGLSSAVFGLPVVKEM